jgi:hypothetical protein
MLKTPIEVTIKGGMFNIMICISPIANRYGKRHIQNMFVFSQTSV